MQVAVSASNMWVKIFIVFMQVGVSVTTMQVVLSVVCNCFSCKMQVTVLVIAIKVTHSSKHIVLSLSDTRGS